MTDPNIVKVHIIGNKVTSTVEGNGIQELLKCIEKLDDGHPWKLEVYSEASKEHISPIAEETDIISSHTSD